MLDKSKKFGTVLTVGPRLKKLLEAGDSWISTNSSIPFSGEVVDTKIDDGDSKRNETRLKREGNLWFFPDGSMYVYYKPTHWKYLDTDSKLW